MTLMSNRTMWEIAKAIQPHYSEIAQTRGQVSHEEVARLIKEHTNHRVVSERTTQIIDSMLCGEIIPN